MMSLQAFESRRGARGKPAQSRKRGGPEQAAEPPAGASPQYLARLQELFDQSPRVSLQRRKADALRQRDGASVQRVRTLSSKDIEGYSAVHEKISGHLGTDQTLVVSVGRSPQVLSKYLEQRGMRVVYLPISGLSGKTMSDYQGLPTQDKENRDSYFHQFIDPQMNGIENIVTVDVGVGGSSNYTVYKEIKGYLERTARGEVTVKMATISPFQDEEIQEIDTSALHHEDNILEKDPLDTTLRGVHRLLKVQYNSIDKDLAFTKNFKFDMIDAGEEVPAVDTEKESELEESLKTAIDKYGFDPDRKRRKNPARPFNKRLLFEKEVNEWKQRNEDRQWREEHPYLAQVVKALYLLAAFSSGAHGGAASMDALDPRYWKRIK